MDLFLKTFYLQFFWYVLYLYALMSIVSLAWQTLSVMNRISCAFGLLWCFFHGCHKSSTFLCQILIVLLTWPDVKCWLLLSYITLTGSRSGTRPDSFPFIVSGLVLNKCHIAFDLFLFSFCVHCYLKTTQHPWGVRYWLELHPEIRTHVMETQSQKTSSLIFHISDLFLIKLWAGT